MKNFVKDNALVLVAILLPVLFAGIFFISKQVTEVSVPPPAHSFLLTERHHNRNSFEIEIINNKLDITFIYPTRNERGQLNSVSQPKLYFVDHATMRAERIHFDIPSDARAPTEGQEGRAVKIRVPRFDNVTFLASEISPDGYAFENYRRRRSGNLMTEIFTGGRSSRTQSLSKDGRYADIEGLENHSNLKIVGWVHGH